MSVWICCPPRLQYISDEVEVTIEPMGQSGAPAYRPDLAETVPGMSPFILWEWVPYRLIVSLPATGETPGEGILIWAGDQPARSLGRGIYTFTYENFLGASELRVEGAPVPNLHVEVFSRKLGLADTPVLYRAMTRDMAQRLSVLPFAVSGPTAHATAISSEPAGPLFTFHFLRQFADRITAAVAQIGESPHRVLTHEEVIRPIGRVQRLDPAAVRWGLTRPAGWVLAVAPAAGWFHRDEIGYLPAELLQQRTQETLDTHENRFVKHFLALLHASTDRTLVWMERVGMGGDTTIGPLVRLREQLAAELAASWLEEVGPFVYLPTESAVLNRMDGYCDLYAVYPEYLLGRTPFGAGLERAVSSRNVADLYEYWCFFRLIAFMEESFGPAVVEPRSDESGALAWGVTAKFERRPWRLAFNRSARGGKASYSVGLRPDFTLLGPNGPELVLDAKFRLDAPAATLDDPAEAVAAPLTDDLYKMHTYRDALGVRAAVSVYPGDLAIFYDRELRRPRCGLTIHDLISDTALQGVGAIPLRPERD